MSVPVSVELANEAAERAVREIADYQTIVTELNLGSQGQSYGTKTMSREDRILAFMVDAKDGALDFLKLVNEQFYRDYVHQFVRDVLASPIMRGTPGVAQMAQYAESQLEEAA